MRLNRILIGTIYALTSKLQAPNHGPLFVFNYRDVDPLALGIPESPVGNGRAPNLIGRHRVRYLTQFGLPPGLPALRFRCTEAFFSLSLIEEALAAGRHLG